MKRIVLLIAFSPPRSYRVIASGQTATGPQTVTGTKPAIVIKTNNLGKVLTTPKKFGIYYWNVEKKAGGKIRCTGQCAVVWPPSTSRDGAEARQGSDGDLRHDQARRRSASSRSTGSPPTPTTTIPQASSSVTTSTAGSQFGRRRRSRLPVPAARPRRLGATAQDGDWRTLARTVTDSVRDCCDCDVGGRSHRSCRFGSCRCRSGVRAPGFRRAGRLLVRVVAVVARAARRCRGGCGSECRSRGRLRPCSHPRGRGDDADSRGARGSRGSSRRRAPSAGGGVPAGGGGARSRGNNRCGRRAPRAAAATPGNRAAAATDTHGEAVTLDLRHDLGVAAKPAGSLGRDQRAVLQVGAAAAVGTERGGVDMDDDARPPTPRARPLQPAMPRRDRAKPRPAQDAEDQRPKAATDIRRCATGSAAASVVVRRCSALLAAPLEHPFTRRLERLDQQRSVLGRKPRPQKQRAVVIQVVVDVLQLMRIRGVLRRDPAKGPERPLELRRRQRTRQLQQTLLRRRGRDPRQRPHLA